MLMGMKCVSKHQDLQIFVLKLNKYEEFSATHHFKWLEI